MEHSRLDFTAAGTANDFFHTFPNYISEKNILSNVFSYAAVAALILLLIIILPCIVRILRQSIQRLATELLHFHFSLSSIEEGNGNPLQCSCLENPRDGGAW